MSEENKALIARAYDQVFNSGNIDALGEIASPDIVDHSALPGSPPGLDGAKQAIEMFLTAFPDLKMTVEDMIAEGDKVAVRLTMSGTHKGDFMGIPATGKEISVSGMDFHRIAGGKVVEHWDSFDQMTMMEQLGVMESPGPG